MIKRILVALSGTPYTPSAIEHALDLARRHGAEVTGVTVLDARRLEEVGPVPIGGGAAAHALAEHRLHLTEERVEAQIAAFEQACRAAGMIHCVVRETGDPMDELILLWRYHDLTIMGLRGLFDYGIFDRPDDLVVRLLGRGVRPILAVGERPRAVRRVLAAYNGSMESAKALKQFIEMGPFPEVELKIACFGFEEAEAEPLLADARSYGRAHGLEPETESVPGYPTEGLLRHAKTWNADLVVMGATSRSRIAKLILGETALHAMQNAEIPLFLSQ